MLRGIIREISKKVESAEGSRAAFRGKGYAPVEFSQANYAGIKNAEGKALVFADGGNAEIISVPGLSLQLARTAAVEMKNNRLQKITRKEFYILAAAEEKEGKLVATAKIYDSKGNKYEAEAGYTNGKSLQKLCESIRKCAEIKLAAEATEENAITVLDGTLEAENETEEKELEKLYETAERKNAIVAAVAKTTTLLTEKGSPFSAMLLQKGPEKSWQYSPVAEISGEKHKAGIFFAKMHEKSRHAFRIEIYNRQKEKIPELVAELAENSKEITFPGYPYGLIMADKMARISEKEAECLKAKIAATAGKNWGAIGRSLSALNAHEILDSI
ncbi:DNA double-strand break repair nuclease NurA [Candidatus Woesearchaeota archaeon]|nr:DNA double-strand break repair nuclease NurA [Candidatus Woesearchaeota archaeon]